MSDKKEKTAIKEKAPSKDDFVVARNPSDSGLSLDALIEALTWIRDNDDAKSVVFVADDIDASYTLSAVKVSAHGDFIMLDGSDVKL